MNNCDLTIAKNIIDDEDFILVLIAKTWIKEEDGMLFHLAEMKNCETEEVTEQDCKDFIKKHPEAVKKHFFKDYKFFVDKIEDLQQLQENGILDKLPNDCRININRINGISKDKIEKIKRKNIIFDNITSFPVDIFNSIIENDFEINIPDWEIISLDGVHSQNMDDTIRNIGKYKNKKFIFPISIDSEKTENLEELEHIMNYDLDADNISMSVNIDTTNTGISNIFDSLKQGQKNWKKIKGLSFNISDESISSLEQIIQHMDLINSNNFPRMDFSISLDEKYIKSLDKSTVEKIDTYLTKLGNSENISFYIGYKPGIERDKGFCFHDINSCFQLCNKTEDIIGCIPRDASDLEKVTYISNWIMQNFSYDYENLDKEKQWEQQNLDKPDYLIQRDRPRLTERNLVQFIEDKTGVCRHVAELTEYLLKKVGVKCEYISSNRHAFNRVYIDGIPYWMDNTWDINRHDENKDYQLSDSEFFLTGFHDFFKTHSTYGAIYGSPECPKTMDRENIKSSIDRTSQWKHILEQSIIGKQLYTNTRSSELVQVGQNFENSMNNKKIEKEGDISNGEY